MQLCFFTLISFYIYVSTEFVVPGQKRNQVTNEIFHSPIYVGEFKEWFFQGFVSLWKNALN